MVKPFNKPSKEFFKLYLSGILGRYSVDRHYNGFSLFLYMGVFPNMHLQVSL